jgi:hypothetical protein
MPLGLRTNGQLDERRRDYPISNLGRKVAIADARATGLVPKRL